MLKLIYYTNLIIDNGMASLKFIPGFWLGLGGGGGGRGGKVL